MVQSLGFRVSGLGFGVAGLGFRVQDIGFRVWEGFGLKVWGVPSPTRSRAYPPQLPPRSRRSCPQASAAPPLFRVECSGFRILDSGSRVKGLGSRV